MLFRVLGLNGTGLPQRAYCTSHETHSLFCIDSALLRHRNTWTPIVRLTTPLLNPQVCAPTNRGLPISKANEFLGPQLRRACNLSLKQHIRADIDV